MPTRHVTVNQILCGKLLVDELSPGVYQLLTGATATTLVDNSFAAIIGCALPATDPPTRFVVLARFDPANVATFYRASGATVTEGVDFEPCGDVATSGYLLRSYCWKATATGAGYVDGDLIDQSQLIDASTGAIVVVDTAWTNSTQGTVIAAAPPLTDLESCDPQPFETVDVCVSYQMGTTWNHASVTHHVTSDGATIGTYQINATGQYVPWVLPVGAANAVYSVGACVIESSINTYCMCDQLTPNGQVVNYVSAEQVTIVNGRRLVEQLGTYTDESLAAIYTVVGASVACETLFTEVVARPDRYHITGAGKWVSPYLTTSIGVLVRTLGNANALPQVTLNGKMTPLLLGDTMGYSASEGDVLGNIVIDSNTGDVITIQTMELRSI